MKERDGAAMLQSRVLEAFSRLSEKDIGEIERAVTALSAKKGFTYERAGVVEPINLMLVPSFCTDAQEAYLKEVSLAVKRGVDAMYNAWFHDDEVRSLMPFGEEEKGWILDCRRDMPGIGEPVWYRLDAHFHMKEKEWKNAVQIFEINSSAVGGIHYGPVAEELFLDCVMPFLKGRLSGLPPLKKNLDQREMLLGLAARHAKAIGRKSLTIAFAEDTTADEGITEGPYIVEHLRSKGVNIRLSDPRDLHVKDGEICDRLGPVDIIYRNFELRDAIDLEKEGFDMAGLRKGFFNRQVVSTLCGEFDHKSMWEALTCGDYDRYFSGRDAEFFKRHLLWTRAVRERRTTGPDGFTIDLLPFAVKNRERLVLKPNRLCGGYGVALGIAAKQGEWEAMLGSALKEDAGWVLQTYSPPEKFTFPLFEQGRLVFEEHNIVYGLTATDGGAGVLGRVSKQGVVNIAQHGGLMPVLRAG